MSSSYDYFARYIKEIVEEASAPAVSVGGGAIAGVGVGPEGDPPGNKFLLNQEPLKRKKNVDDVNREYITR